MGISFCSLAMGAAQHKPNILPRSSSIVSAWTAPPLPAIALSTDSSILTSIGNDYSFSEVFSKQIVALGREGDIAIGISTSGTSANVIRAIEVAKEMGLETVALTGNDGGDLAKVANYSLIVSSNSTPCIQEVHMAVVHILCEMVEAQIFKMAY